MSFRSCIASGYEFRMLDLGEGTPLVFLHGAGGLSMTPLLERLSSSFRVIAPEHPGFGTSEIPDWMMSVGDISLHYLSMLKALDLEDVHLVGHSLGGWIAADLAVRSTERISTLSLLSPAGVRGSKPFGDIFLWSAEETARRGCFNRELAEARAEAAASLDVEVTLRNRAATARIAWNPRLHDPQLPFWLHRIDIPTLLVWGQRDEIIPPECAETFLKAIPDARLESFPDAGHALAFEKPVETAAAITQFIGENRS